MLYGILLAAVLVAFAAGRAMGIILNRRDDKIHNRISGEINKIITTGFAGQVSPHRDISIANEIILLLRDYKK